MALIVTSSNPTGLVFPINSKNCASKFLRSVIGFSIIVPPMAVGGAKSPCPISASITAGLRFFLSAKFTIKVASEDFPVSVSPINKIVLNFSIKILLTISCHIVVPALYWSVSQLSPPSSKFMFIWQRESISNGKILPASTDTSL